MPLNPAADMSFFVGGLGVDATELQLRTAFADVGVALTRVELVVNRATGFRRGFAFVGVDPQTRGPARAPSETLEQMRRVTVNGRKGTVTFVPVRLH